MSLEREEYHLLDKLLIQLAYKGNDKPSKIHNGDGSLLPRHTRYSSFPVKKEVLEAESQSYEYKKQEGKEGKEGKRSQGEERREAREMMGSRWQFDGATWVV